MAVGVEVAVVVVAVVAVVVRFYSRLAPVPILSVVCVLLNCRCPVAGLVLLLICFPQTKVTP